MARIRFDIETLRPTDTGSALGQIWMEIGTRSLPCPRWDDFIVFVLDWWRYGMKLVLTESPDQPIFAFMDDPYEISVDRIDEGYKFTCRFNDEEIAAEIEDRAGMIEFATTYCETVGAVLDRVQQDHAWRKTYLGSTPQIDDLREDLPRIKSLLEKFAQPE